MTASTYDHKFFADIDQGSFQSALEIVPLLLKLFPASSVLDVGCGIGSWLKVFEDAGVHDYLGIDGDYVDLNTLRIPREKFKAADVSKPIDLDRKYDLAVCLEVGEHLPPDAAPALVKTLASASDVIVFSAAIPSQGGVKHVNEQWPAYWAELFKAQGYTCIDCIRPQLWDNPRVGQWFVQNMLVYARGEVTEQVAGRIGNWWPADPPRAIVHPWYFERANMALADFHELRTVPRLPWALRALAKSFVFSLRHRFSWL
jgi:SAM-dependent methyltransferase